MLPLIAQSQNFELMNLRVFSITIGVLSSLLVCSNYIPLPYDMFVITDDTIRSLINQLPIEQKAALKVAHALNTSRYDIGLFGNSRIEMIGQQHIGEQHGHLFNFSLPKSSFRQSVKLLKELADQNRAPRMSIICLNHVGLDMDKSDGDYPGFPCRLLLRAKEISYLARLDSISKTNLVRLIYLTLVREFRLFTLKININLVITRLQLYFPFIDRPKAGELDIYRQDGSFVQILPEKERESPSELFSGVDTSPLLEYDLQTLSDIARKGIKIVIYESPLSPRIYQRIETNLTPNAHLFRARLKKKCAQIGLHYYTAPYLGNNPQNLVWPDTTHPPAQLLGLWLQGVLDEVENKTKKPGIN